MLNNYKSVLAVLLVGLILVVGGWAIYTFYSLGDKLIKVPLTDNVFVTKNAGESITEVDLFNRYLSYMSNNGYEYLPEDRMGGLLSFAKNGKRVTVVYPKFIKLK